MHPWLWALVAAGVAEVGVRVSRARRRRVPVSGAWRQPVVKVPPFTPHPYALYVKKPHARAPYPSNRWGHAGTREVTKARLPHSVRIYCVGGSPVEDYDPARGPDASWPGQLQDLLGQRYPGTTFECLNAAAAGYTSAESLAEFLFRGIDFAPDILLVYHNVNDAWSCQMVEGFQSDYAHARRHKAWQLGWANGLPQLPFWWTYQWLRRQAVARFGRGGEGLFFWVADPPWQVTRTFQPAAVQAFQRNIRNLVQAARSWGCRPVLIKWECDWAARQLPSCLKRQAGTEEVYFEFLHANNAALAQVASQAEGCTYLDVGPFLPQHFTDTIHFSPVGFTEMARRVADGIDPLIRALIGSPRATAAAGAALVDAPH